MPKQFNIVKDDQRSDFLVNHFLDPLFDMKVFTIADMMLEGYNGGYWLYVEGPADAAYQIPAFMQLGPGDTMRNIVNPHSGESVQCDNRLAGMILTSYAMLLSREVKHANRNLDYKISVLNAAIRDYCRDTGQMNVWYAVMD